jgi:CHAD domain-containing protein
MEIEAKFSVPDDEVLAKLLAADELAGFRLAPAVELELLDVYLDTVDGRLAAAGYTLRRRSSGDAFTVTMKQATAPPAAADAATSAEEHTTGPRATTGESAETVEAAGADDASRSAPALDTALRREELEIALLDLPAGDGLDIAALPPGPLRARLLEVVGTEPVVRLLALAQKRLARDAFDGDRLVAEVSLDAVAVGGAAGEQVYFELEAELRPDGTDDDLEALAGCLRDDWGLAAETRSKFARALEVAGPPADIVEPAAAEADDGEGEEAKVAETMVEEPAPSKPAAKPAAERKSPGIAVDDLMSEAARKTLLFHFERMLAHEKGTRDGDDYEELHDMRVATRRMRAALSVFEPYIDAAAYQPHLKDLRKTGRALGAVRDLDVFHEKAEAYLEELPEERRSELDPLFDAWRVERARCREAMIDWLDGRRFRVFVETFGAFLETPSAGALPDFDRDGAPLARRVSLALPPVVELELGNVLAFDEWVGRADVPLARLHRLRIAGKYLRYTLEFFAEVLGPGGKLVVHKIKSLQDHLGDLQDAVVTSAILRDFLSGQGWGRKAGKRARAEGTDLIVAPGVANYLAYKQNELDRLVRTFPEAWEPIREARYRHTIASLLGKL